MSDRVSPRIQRQQSIVPNLPMRVSRLDGWPNLDTKTAEIASEVSWSWISSIQLTSQHKDIASPVSNSGICDRGNPLIATFIVKVSAKRLKLRCKYDYVHVIGLFGRVAATASGSTDSLMNIFHILQLLPASRVPDIEGIRGHCTSRDDC